MNVTGPWIGLDCICLMTTAIQSNPRTSDIHLKAISQEEHQPSIITDGKSTLVQVTSWCHEATRRYLRQCCPRSLSPYGPVTMIVLASGHQVCCMPWMQMGAFNKEVGFLMWIKIPCIEYILWGIPTIEFTIDVVNMVKNATVKDVPIYNDALLNIQAS